MAGPPSGSGAWSRSRSRSSMALVGWWAVAKGRDRVRRSRCARCRPSSRSGCAGWRCSWRCRSSISARSRRRSQMARFDRGTDHGGRFDWQAMAFDFGPAGRRAARARSRAAGPADQRKLARGGAWRRRTATTVDDRGRRRATASATLDRRLRVVPRRGRAVPPRLREAVAATRYCRVDAVRRDRWSTDAARSSPARLARGRARCRSAAILGARRQGRVVDGAIARPRCRQGPTRPARSRHGAGRSAHGRAAPAVHRRQAGRRGVRIAAA